MNTAAKIIGAPLPSILDIFLTRCSSKANSIVKDPTHSSRSLFQLLPSWRLYRNIRARSARLLNSFSPQAVRALNSAHPAPLWNPKQAPTSWNMDHHTQPPNPLTLPHHRKKLSNFLCNSKWAKHRWVGLYKPPVVTHSPLFALDTFHTLLCVHNPKKRLNNICMFTCSSTKNYLALFPSQPLDSRCSLCTCTVFEKHLYSCTVCIFLCMYR